MPQRDALYLELIQEAVEDIERRFGPMAFEVYMADRDEQALAAFRLSIIGENANKISDGIKGRHAQIPWQAMVAFRHIVSHEYHRVDPILVWETLHDLHAIADMVECEINRLEEPE